MTPGRDMVAPLCTQGALLGSLWRKEWAGETFRRGGECNPILDRFSQGFRALKTPQGLGTPSMGCDSGCRRWERKNVGKGGPCVHKVRCWAVFVPQLWPLCCRALKVQSLRSESPSGTTCPAIRAVALPCVMHCSLDVEGKGSSQEVCIMSLQ